MRWTLSPRWSPTGSAKTNRVTLSKIALPEAARALDAQARQIDTPCGRGSMRWRVWSKGANDLPPLLLLHGGSGSWMHWVRTIPAFMEERTVIAPDTPGLGQSARPAHPEQLVSYAHAIADGLPVAAGGNRAIDICAFSFGSIVTGALLGLASFEPRKLVLVGPAALGVSKLDRDLVPVRHLHGEDRRRANIENLSILMFADPAKIDEAAIAIQDWHTRHARTNSPKFARTTSLREALIAWGRPFAAITGEKDAPSQPALVCGKRGPGYDAGLGPSGNRREMRSRSQAACVAARLGQLLWPCGHWAQSRDGVWQCGPVKKSASLSHEVAGTIFRRSPRPPAVFRHSRRTRISAAWRICFIIPSARIRVSSASPSLNMASTRS